MRAAAIQLNSTGDKARNLEAAERLVRAAAGDGAELVAAAREVEPARRPATLLAGAEPLDGPTISRRPVLGARARRPPARRQHRRARRGRRRLFNTSVLIGPDGELEARYRKIHMFDVDVGGVAYRESEHEEPGDEIVSAALGAGLDGVTARADGLLRPPLPRALPDPRRPRRDRVHGAVGLHARHRQGPLGGAAAGPRDREPGVRRRRRTRSARRRRTTAPTAAPRSSTPGASCWRRRPTRSASSPPTSTSSARSGSARRCPRSPTAGPAPTRGRSRGAASDA